MVISTYVDDKDRVAKTCQPCQPVDANFSRPVLIFGQSRQKKLYHYILCSGATSRVALVLTPVLLAPVLLTTNTNVASTSALCAESEVRILSTLYCSVLVLSNNLLLSTN